MHLYPKVIQYFITSLGGLFEGRGIYPIGRNYWTKTLLEGMDLSKKVWTFKPNSSLLSKIMLVEDFWIEFFTGLKKQKWTFAEFKKKDPKRDA